MQQCGDVVALVQSEAPLLGSAHHPANRQHQHLKEGSNPGPASQVCVRHYLDEHTALTMCVCVSEPLYKSFCLAATQQLAQTDSPGGEERIFLKAATQPAPSPPPAAAAAAKAVTEGSTEGSETATGAAS